MDIFSSPLMSGELGAIVGQSVALQEVLAQEGIQDFELDISTALFVAAIEHQDTFHLLKYQARVAARLKALEQSAASLHLRGKLFALRETILQKAIAVLGNREKRPEIFAEAGANVGARFFTSSSAKRNRGLSLAKVSVEQLVKVLERHGGNQAKAARELEIGPSAVSLRISRAKKGSPLLKK